MDEQRFDAALRALGRGTNRRQAVAGALGALFGGGLLGAAAKGGDGAAGKDRGRGKGKGKGKPAVEGPCGDGSRKDNLCTRNSECCTGICKTGLRNRDGQGRCRCLKKGKACKADKNCCNEMSCSDGVCTKSNPTPPPLIPTGGACVEGGTPCADSNATCTTYKAWANGETGTYCLLDVEAACTAATDCTVNSCYRGACVACSCEACATVDCSSPTVATGGDLQAAISAATSGDVITIAPGTYTGDFEVPGGTTLTLVGCGSGSDEVILKNATYGQRTLKLSASNGQLNLIDIVVQGYNDIGNTEAGGGIEVNNGTLNLCARTRVEDNYWENLGGGVSVGGVNGQRGTANVLDHTIIQNNTASGPSADGGGIGVDSYADGVIDGMAQLLDNSADGSGGGAWAETNGSLVIQGGVQIKRNYAKLYGGGAAFYPNPSATTATPRLTIGGNVVIDGNSADSYGGGVAGFFVTAGTVHNELTIKDDVQITNNASNMWGGGGVAFFQGTLLIKDRVKITGNTANAGTQKFGGGVSVALYSNPEKFAGTITGDVEISGNQATDRGGGIYLYGVSLTLSGNVVVKDNTSQDKGGGMWVGSSGTITVSESASISNNTATNSGGGIYSNDSGDTVTTVAGSVHDNLPDNCAGSGTLTCS